MNKHTLYAIIGILAIAGFALIIATQFFGLDLSRSQAVLKTRHDTIK